MVPCYSLPSWLSLSRGLAHSGGIVLFRCYCLFLLLVSPLLHSLSPVLVELISTNGGSLIRSRMLYRGPVDFFFVGFFFGCSSFSLELVIVSAQLVALLLPFFATLSFCGHRHIFWTGIFECLTILAGR